MTVNEYISGKFQKCGIELSDADLLGMSLSSGISGDDEMEEGVHANVHVSMAGFIPELLLRADSVSESGFSMRWDINGIKSYYALLCRKYGLEDKLSDKPKVTFL
jgi:hypothetical protein